MCTKPVTVSYRLNMLSVIENQLVIKFLCILITIPSFRCEHSNTSLKKMI